MITAKIYSALQVAALLGAAIFFVATNAIASEEDIAKVTCSAENCVAEPTVAGPVNITFKKSFGVEGQHLDSLTLRVKGKEVSVPENALSLILKIDTNSIRVSSEIGYPTRGLGPYLYIRIPGVCGENPKHLEGPTDCLFTFSENSFVSLERVARRTP